MDILLIDPPYKSLKGIGSECGYSMSTVSLGAYLKNNGIDASILSGDLLADLPVQPSFSFNVRQYSEGQNLYAKIIMDDNHSIWQKISDAILSCRPKLIGITYLTPMAHSAKKIAELAKKIDKNIVVIAGGHHPSFCPAETLSDQNIDVVVRGEGEIPLLRLVETLLSDASDVKSINGISFKDQGNIIENPDGDMILDLDSLPFPARDLVHNCDYSRYRLHRMITARGCPYNCSFCSDKSLWRGKIRRRSIGSIMKEIRMLIRDYDIKYIDLVDGTFTYDRRYVVDFCNAVRSKGLNIKWRCTARYDNLDENLINLMAKSNCKGLYFGLESGSQNILNGINKQINLKDIIKTSEIVNKSGITSVTSVIIGLPDETRSDIEATLNLMKSIKTSIYDINSFVPLPGTPLHKGQAIDWLKVGFKSLDNYFSTKISQKDLCRYIETAYDIAQDKLEYTIKDL
jgi:anaerobic magnesium-protoporphyrin IX monomethyl ester cyclase